MLYISLSIFYYFRNIFKVRPGSWSHACFYPRSTCYLGGFHLLLLACQNDPSRDRLTRQMILLFFSCQDWNGRISTHYCLFLQGVFKHPGCLLSLDSQPCPIWTLTWGSAPFLRVLLIFLVSPAFFEGVLKLSEILQLFPHELDDLSRPIYLGVPALVAGSDIYPLIFRRSLRDPRPLFSLLYRGDLWSSWKDCFAIVSDVPGSLLSDLCYRHTLTNKILMYCFSSVWRAF